MNCPDNETFELAINIAQTLEKLQDLNPELYGNWYTKLYHPVDADSWNVETLHTLEQLLISETL